jgi:hypothetical protein
MPHEDVDEDAKILTKTDIDDLLKKMKEGEESMEDEGARDQETTESGTVSSEGTEESKSGGQ